MVVSDEVSIWNQTQPIYNGTINISIAENPSNNKRTFVMHAASLNHTPVFFPNFAGDGFDLNVTLYMDEDSLGTLYVADNVSDVDVFSVTTAGGDPQTNTTIGDGTMDVAGSELSLIKLNSTIDVYSGETKVNTMLLPLPANMTTNYSHNQVLDPLNPFNPFNGSEVSAWGITFAQSGGPYDYVGTNGKLIATTGGMDKSEIGSQDFQAVIQWWLCCDGNCPTPSPTPTASPSPSPSPSATATASPSPTPTATGQGPEAIDDLSVISVECNWARLQFGAPDNGAGGPVSSYEVRCSTAGPITEGNWPSATNVTADTDFANMGTPRNPDVAETCTVNGLDDLTDYYFAVKSTYSGQSSDVSNSPDGSTIQREHKPGDWWLWHIRYNQTTPVTCFTSLVTNDCYHLTNVFEVGASKYVEADEGVGVTCTNLSRINWNCDETDNRWRIVSTGVALYPYAENIMHDCELWINSRDFTMWSAMEALTEATAKLMYNCAIEQSGDAPADNFLTYQQGDASANCPTPGSPDDGYPYAVSQTWDTHQFIVPYAAAAANLSKNYDWNVNASPSNFDAAANTDLLGAAHAGAGNYSAWETYYCNESNSADYVRLRYAPAVHTYVKQIDRNAYIGWEEWIILDYEVGNYSASNLSAGTQGSNPTISIDITNDTDAPRTFDLLTLVTNMSTNMTYGGDYKNGRTVYPTMHNYSSIQEAIHTTQTINPGATVNENWSIYWTNESGDCDLWCAGLFTWQ